MTTSSQVSRPDSRPEDGSAPGPAPWCVADRVAVVAGIVALLCAVALPLLPVWVSTPVVSWPVDPAAPTSTTVALTTQRPVALDASLDCTALRAAGAADGVALGTVPPRAADAAASGLTVRVTGGRATVTSRGQRLADVALPAGPCSLRVAGDLGGMTVSLDGREVGHAGGRTLPDVDALLTSVPPSADGAPAGLAVRLSVDDQFDTTPTVLKGIVIGLLVAAVAVTLGALAMRDRRRRPGARSPWARPSVVDVAVPVIMVGWAFLAPMTDDDGYYGAMAANVPFTGYVANYYQLYNQGFTPFTWIYYALAWWQSTVGAAPVLQRLPALALGVLLWVLVRRYAARALPDGGGVGRARLVRWALAVAVLAWWLPFDMGVRPEAIVAAGVVATLLGLSVTAESGRRAPAALGLAAAAFGMTAAPTGFVALAPLLAGGPAVWRRLRRDLDAWQAAATVVAILAPAALAGALAFADGSLRDFVRAQQIFLGMQTQETWYTEMTRWSYLLDDQGAMGSYAKRAPVLIGLIALVIFLVLRAAAGRRGDGAGLPGRFEAAGWTTVLGFALLWLTPSKWTHHFGTLAGVGPLLIALVLVVAPRAVRPRWPALVGVAVLLAVVMALAGHGPNQWPYSWMLGVPHAGLPPQVGPFAFGQPLWWLLGIAALTVVVTLVARRRAPSWQGAAPAVALALTVVVFLGATTVYMVGGLALATSRTRHTWSPWAAAVADPLGRRCVAASEMEVLDPATAVPLPTAPGAPPPPPSEFAPGGFYPGNRPPSAPGAEAWGSFLPPGAGPSVGDGVTGGFATPWYAIPDRPGAAMTASVAGRTGGGNVLRVQYGHLDARRAVVTTDHVLGEDHDGKAVDSTVWRSLLLEGPDGPPPGTTMMRLVADDSSTATGGWLAVTTPTTQRWTALTSHLDPRQAVAVSWQDAFLFPCQRKPVQAAGINEPVTAAVVWGGSPLAYRDDGIWQLRRGGLFAQSLRDSEVTELVTRLQHAPDAPAGQVYELRTSLPDRIVRVDRSRALVNGWAPAPNTTFSTPSTTVIRPGL